MTLKAFIFFSKPKPIKNVLKWSIFFTTAFNCLFLWILAGQVFVAYALYIIIDSLAENICHSEKQGWK